MTRTLNLQKDYEIYSWYNMLDGEICSFKMPALIWRQKKREGKEDWKINGVCDWQPMILGISENWIRQRESVGHSAKIHWYTLIDIQRHYPPSHSLATRLGHKTLHSRAPRPEGFQNQTSSSIWDQPRGCVPIPKSLHFAPCWQDVK